jgi:hypothetical protein
MKKGTFADRFEQASQHMSSVIKDAIKTFARDARALPELRQMVIGNLDLTNDINAAHLARNLMEFGAWSWISDIIEVADDIKSSLPLRDAPAPDV